MEVLAQWRLFAGKRVIRIAATTGFVMFAFEMAKTVLSPNISIWTSHFLTLLFVTTMVTAIGSFVLVRDEVQYRLLFNSNPIPMWVFDRRTLRFLEVNEAAVQKYGFSESEFLAMTLMDIRPEEDVPKLLEHVGIRDDGLQDPEVWRHRTKSGKVIDVEIVCHDLNFRRTDAMLVAVYDITERNHARRLLEDRENRYRVLFEDSADAYLLLDEGGFVDGNSAALEMFGLSNKSELRHPASLSPLNQPDGTPSLIAAEERIAAAFRNGKARFEWLHQRENGEVFPADVYLSALTLGGRPMLMAAVRDITVRIQAEQALSIKTALLEAQSETTLDGILAVDEAKHIILVNKQFGLQFGISREMLASRDDHSVLKHVAEQVKDRPDVLIEQLELQFGISNEMLTSRDDHGVLEQVAEQVKDHPDAFIERIEYLYEHRHEKSREEIELKNGQVFDRYSTPLVDSAGIHRGRIWYFRDITERKMAESALRQAEEKYRAIFEDSVVGIFQITPEGRPISINRALAQLHGYKSPEELMSEVHNVAEQLFVDPTRMIEVAQVASTEGMVRDVEVEVYCKDRSRKWVQVNQRAVRDADNDILCYEGTIEDITERKAAEERVQFLAYYDALTELPNRTLFKDRLEHGLAGARRTNGKVGLLHLDLDQFKVINDSLGHTMGDHLLKAVADRLKSCTREQDTLARVGGDSFMVLLDGIVDTNEAAVAAGRIVQGLTGAFNILGRALNVTCSLGICIFPEHGADGETLLKNVDATMFWAKENGRNNTRFFTEDLNTQAVDRLRHENALRLALERDQFFLVYQPQMRIASGEITGLEALIRWQHPEFGLVPTDKFIAIAETSGLILPIGEWVLKTACAQAKKWHDEGVLGATVAVNVSALQFRQEGFCELIRRVLVETGLPAQYLELELTEGVLLSNADKMISVLQELREIGVKLAIDDFGMGYSSLSYLKHFTVDKLKIDRSFISDIATGPDDAAIAAAIVRLGKSLNLTVIAEGVETEAQMTFLREHDCDEIQGYYFSKPIAVVEVAEKLRSSRIERANALKHMLELQKTPLRVQ